MSSLLHSVPPCLHGTAEGLARRRRRHRRRLRTHRHPCTSEERAGRGRRPGGRPRSPGQGVSRTSIWPWAPAIVQAAAAGLRWAITSLTSISCLTRSRPHEGRVPSTARRSKRPATSAHRRCAGDRRSPHLQRHKMPGSARHRAAASATRLPTISAAKLDARLSGAQQAVGRRGVSHAPCRRWLACEASSGDRLHPRLTHRACWLDRLGELHDRPSADGAGLIVGAAPGRCRARSDAVTGNRFGAARV